MGSSWQPAIVTPPFGSGMWVPKFLSNFSGIAGRCILWHIARMERSWLAQDRMEQSRSGTWKTSNRVHSSWLNTRARCTLLHSLPMAKSWRPGDGMARYGCGMWQKERRISCFAHKKETHGPSASEITGNGWHLPFRNPFGFGKWKPKKKYFTIEETEHSTRFVLPRMAPLSPPAAAMVLCEFGRSGNSEEW